LELQDSRLFLRFLDQRRHVSYRLGERDLRGGLLFCAFTRSSLIADVSNGTTAAPVIGSTLSLWLNGGHPRAVLPVKLGGRVVPESILRDVQVFMLFYLLTFAVGTAIVIALGADLITGITATIACLGNIGPGFDDVGPMANFAGLHPVSKVVLTLEMWIGRLEVLTVLVFFRLEPWRSMRWTAGA
jgi:Trk-type K+ transport system membrane component